MVPPEYIGQARGLPERVARFGRDCPGRRPTSLSGCARTRAARPSGRRRDLCRRPCPPQRRTRRWLGCSGASCARSPTSVLRTRSSGRPPRRATTRDRPSGPSSSRLSWLSRHTCRSSQPVLVCLATYVPSSSLPLGPHWSNASRASPCASRASEAFTMPHSAATRVVVKPPLGRLPTASRRTASRRPVGKTV